MKLLKLLDKIFFISFTPHQYSENDAARDQFAVNVLQNIKYCSVRYELFVFQDQMVGTL